MFQGDCEKDIDSETYAPVIDFTLVRLLLSVATQRGLSIGQLDFLSAFLQAWINRRVYMSPLSF